MIKDKTQKQESGDNSANYQAETINQYGISYKDAKEIALDVFQQNFLSLSEQAKKTARERAEELTNAFLDEIKEKNPELLSSVQEPSMQNALYSAQKSYAISGDKDTADLLIDILVERAEYPERSLIQIVFDESLEVVSKLTIEQLNALSLIFLLEYSFNSRIVNVKSLKEFLDEIVKPLAENLPKENFSYKHLEYCNCISREAFMRSSLEDYFTEPYNGIFNHGISVVEIKSLFEYRELPVDLIVPSPFHKFGVQINARNTKDLEEKFRDVNLSEELVEILRNIFEKGVMTSQKVKEVLLSQGEYMKVLFEAWENTDISTLILTSVGMALGSANLKRVTGIELDLSQWIS